MLNITRHERCRFANDNVVPKATTQASRTVEKITAARLIKSRLQPMDWRRAFSQKHLSTQGVAKR